MVFLEKGNRLVKSMLERINTMIEKIHSRNCPVIYIYNEFEPKNCELF